MKNTKLYAVVLRCLMLLCAGSLLSLESGQARADRCADDGNGNWSCSHYKRFNYYWCNGYYIPRPVRWQVPEGTPPAGGWPVAFYYAGTQFTDTSHAFERDADAELGMVYETRMIHELLDDPAGSGKKYAVFVADPPASSGWAQFWHTNVVNPYSASCDYDFFPDYFGEIKSGKYGAASQYNMNRRFAYGVSSGGYNTSRMAVTFNSGSSNGNTWKALGVIAASYATCSGPYCSVPSNLPANHPPTKFWHGTSDNVVPIYTMREYYDALIFQGFSAQKHEHAQGHEGTVDLIGSTGVKQWFDAYY